MHRKNWSPWKSSQWNSQEAIDISVVAKILQT